MPKKILILLVIIGFLCTSGCWSKRELNEIAIVLGLGIDEGEKGQVELTVQLDRPSFVSAPQAKGGGGSPGKATIMLSSQGKTMFDAIRNFITVSSRKLFFSHTEIIVFGEDLAKKGLAPILDLLVRDPEFRPGILILVSKGKAKAIMELPSLLESTSAAGVGFALKAAPFLSKATQVTFFDFTQKYSSKASSAIVPRIEIIKDNKEEKFRISGMAVFKKDKLVDWLNETQTRGLLWVLGKVRGGILVVNAPDKKGKISIEIKGSKSRIKPFLKEGRPVVLVELEGEGNIGELTVPVDISKPETIRLIEKNIAAAIKGEIETALNFAREHQTDFFGFGEAFHRKYPGAWKEMEAKWEEELPGLEVQIAVKAKIREIGETTQSIAPK